MNQTEKLTPKNKVSKYDFCSIALKVKMLVQKDCFPLMLEVLHGTIDANKDHLLLRVYINLR